MNSTGKLTAENVLNGKLNFPLAADGMDTTDADVVAEDILEGKIAYAQGKKITGNMKYLGDLELAAGIDEVIIDPGYITGGVIAPVTAEIDENIIPENIKSGISILGVEGNMMTGLDAMDATATSADILSGKTAYAQGNKIVGTLVVTDNIQTEEELATSIGLTPDKIKKGEIILGVEGTFGIDTSNATVTADDIAENKIAYANDEEIIGTIPVRSGIYNSENINCTVNTAGMRISLPIEEKVIFEAGSEIVTNQNNFQLANAIELKPEDILSGKTILGINGTATSDSDATSNDLVLGKEAYVDGQKIIGTIEVQAGDIVLQNEIQYVEDIDGDYFNINMNDDNKKIIASLEEVIEDFEKELHYRITAAKIAELIGLTPDKIVQGNTILGIVGTAGQSGIDTSDATATSEDIAYGKTAYVNNEKVTGTVDNVQTYDTYHNGPSFNPAVTEDISENTEYNTIGIKHNIATNTLLRKDSYYQADVKMQDMATAIGLTSDKLKTGETVLGITGN